MATSRNHRVYLSLPAIQVLFSLTEQELCAGNSNPIIAEAYASLGKYLSGARAGAIQTTLSLGFTPTPTMMVSPRISKTEEEILMQKLRTIQSNSSE